MRRTLALVIALAAALGPAPTALPASAAPSACPPPRCRDLRVPVPDGLKVPDSRIRVILPRRYRSQGRGYPVLYLLHGAGDTYRTWSENTDVVRFSRRFRIIIVMPDGGHGPEAGWYSDWKDGSRDWETFHTKVLRRFVDRRFNTLGRGNRAVAGLSMGGFGAMSYAARHPGMFQAAASFSGAVDTMYLAPASGAGYRAFRDQFGTPDERVWGDQLQDEDTWRAHNPTDRAADLGCMDLFLATGTGTPGGPAGDDPSNPGGYAIENFIFQQNESYARALRAEDIEFHSDFYLGGYHDWPYWERALHWALPQIYEIVRRGGTGGFCAVPASWSLS